MENWEADIFAYTEACTLVHIPTGMVLAAGVQGHCNSKEKKYANKSPYDLVNTIKKMAQKRALVAAVLIATNASDQFTQDMEDSRGSSSGGGNSGSGGGENKSSRPPVGTKKDVIFTHVLPEEKPSGILYWLYWNEYDRMSVWERTPIAQHGWIDEGDWTHLDEKRALDPQIPATIEVGKSTYWEITAMPDFKPDAVVPPSDTGIKLEDEVFPKQPFDAPPKDPDDVPF